MWEAAAEAAEVVLGFRAVEVLAQVGRLVLGEQAVRKVLMAWPVKLIRLEELLKLAVVAAGELEGHRPFPEDLFLQ